MNLKESKKFTKYALGEMTPKNAMTYLDELYKEGHSKEEILSAKTEIKQLANSICEEFEKDRVKSRLKASQRDELLKPKKNILKRAFDSFFGSLSLLTQINKPVAAIAVILFFGYQYGVKKNKELTSGIFSKSSGNILNEMDDYSESHNTLSLSKGVTLPSSPMEEYHPQMNTEKYDHINPNEHILTSVENLSTFSIDVDTASYTNSRRMIKGSGRVEKHAVRVEEFINYFSYTYDMNYTEHPIAARADVVESVWNKGRKIVRVAVQAKPVGNTKVRKNLVYLVDTSGSMNDPSKLKLVKDSIVYLTRNLDPEDRVAIVTYAGSSGLALSSTAIKDRRKILKSLKNMRGGGGTNGSSGINLAYKVAKENFIDGGVNRVILATDGDFNVGVTNRGGLVELVKEKAKDGIFLTVAGFGIGNYNDAMLEEISNKGNGNYSYIDSMEEIKKMFGRDMYKNLVTVAKDVKIQVDFNPNKVQAYRLIGYENRMLKKQDFNNDKKDAGEIGAGATVTALYEIVPVGMKFEGNDVTPSKYKNEKTLEAKSSSSDELLTVRVRYKGINDFKSTRFDTPLVDSETDISEADKDFQFALAVASFGLKLRSDELTKDMSYSAIRSLAYEGKGDDPFNERLDFIDLVDMID